MAQTMTPAGRGPLLNQVVWVEAGLAIFIVSLRIYARRFIMKKFDWADALILASLVIYLTCAVLATIGTFYGLGNLHKNVPRPSYIMAVKLEQFVHVIGILSAITSKGSVTVFLLRIAIKRWHKVVLWFCMITTISVCVTFDVMFFMQCSPVEKTWNRMIPGTCWSGFVNLAIFAGAYYISLDFLMALLPWLILWDINMPRKDKQIAGFGLSLSVFAGLCGIARSLSLSSTRSFEYIYATVPLLIWSFSEMLICIICASVPFLRPLFMSSRRKQFGYGSSSSSQLK